MKKYRWLIIGLMLLIYVFILIFLWDLRYKNIDMTEMRLLITYWKEYVSCVVLSIICYLIINKVLKE